MASQWKSVLGGAAAAALLILPATAGDNGWTSGPWRGFDVKSVKIDTLVGKLRIEVKPQAKVSLQVSGNKSRVDGVTIHADNGRLVIEGENGNAVWDWRNWFNFSQPPESSNGLDVHLVVPKGTDIDVEDLVGDATVGDTDGDLRFEAAVSDATIGKVRQAHVSMAGSGKIVMSDVAGDLHLEIAGSGKIKAASAASVKADVAGSGTAELGPIAGGLNLDIAGSGDFSAQRVNGPVHVDIVGAGSVRIAQGEANPLHLDIMGAGNFTFGGEAVDPHISALGSGSVKLRSYRGRMDSDGMVDVKVGPDGFPAPPAPPAPPKGH